MATGVGTKRGDCTRCHACAHRIEIGFVRLGHVRGERDDMDAGLGEPARDGAAIEPAGRGEGDGLALERGNSGSHDGLS